MSIIPRPSHRYPTIFVNCRTDCGEKPENQTQDHLVEDLTLTETGTLHGEVSSAHHKEFSINNKELLVTFRMKYNFHIV